MISIHAAREGGDVYAELFDGMTEISIHAAREGGDGFVFGHFFFFNHFNPRRP